MAHRANPPGSGAAWRAGADHVRADFTPQRRCGPLSDVTKCPPVHATHRVTLRLQILRSFYERRPAVPPDLDRREDWVGPYRLPVESHHHRHRRRHPLPDAARDQFRGRHRCDRGGGEARRRQGRAVRRRRIFHPDLLRPVRAAHDRPPRHPLSDRGARRLHELCGRPQCRRQRLHRRRGALPHLFALRALGDRRRQDLLHRRPDLLARQCDGARPRRRLGAAGGHRHRPVAVLGQPQLRLRHPRHARDLCGLGLAHARA